MLLGMQRYMAIRRQSDPVVQNQTGEVHSPADGNGDEAVIARVLGGDRNAYRLMSDQNGARALGSCRRRMPLEPVARGCPSVGFLSRANVFGTGRRGRRSGSIRTGL